MEKKILCVVCAAFVAGTLAACKPVSQTDDRNDSSNAWKEAPTVTPEGADGVPLAAARGLDIGDVEAAVSIEGVLAEKSQAPNVAVDELVSMRGDLDMTTVTVAPPYPEELWITFRVTSDKTFKERPVVLRAKVEQDGRIAERLLVVLDAESTKTPGETTVEVMSHVQGPPKAILLHAQGEVFFLPEGADPQTVAIPPEETGAVLSNPVRINFTPAKEAP